MPIVLETPLNPWHRDHKAALTEFGGWELPLWYETGAVAEHRSVIRAAGLFDTGHMDLFSVTGPGAFNLLQLCFSRDLRAVPTGRCAYGVFLNDQGGVIDDAVVYAQAANDFLVVVNAGRGGLVLSHLEFWASGAAPRLTALSDRLGKMDLQGPASARIMAQVLDQAQAVLQGLAYFSFRGHADLPAAGHEAVRLKDGTPLLLSRTGFTGEFGFELIVRRQDMVRVWEQLLEVGRPLGLTPCGLAARDSLRTGAMLPLSQQDIGPWPFVRNPWTVALPLRSDGPGFTKRFVGDQALLSAEKADNTEYTAAFAGFDPRKVGAPGGIVLDDEGRGVGQVLTCVSDMAIGRHEGRILSLATPHGPAGLRLKGLACGFIKTHARPVPGDRVRLKDDRREIEVEIVTDIRPDRTARRAMHAMLQKGEEEDHEGTE
jgi:aminomethyltransferase